MATDMAKAAAGVAGGLVGPIIGTAASAVIKTGLDGVADVLRSSQGNTVDEEEELLDLEVDTGEQMCESVAAEEYQKGVKDGVAAGYNAGVADAVKALTKFWCQEIPSHPLCQPVKAGQNMNEINSYLR
eukprot:Trichotokara_eunicae@DN9223_c0_g1_i1.p1